MANGPHGCCNGAFPHSRTTDAMTAPSRPRPAALRPLRRAVLSTLIGLGLAASAAEAAETAKLSVLASGFNQPMVVTSAAGDERLFVAEKGGRIYGVDRTTGQRSLFLDLSDRVATQGERGLLGLTLDPDFARNGRFYVDYSEKTQGHTVIERYEATGALRASASTTSALRIMTVEQPAGETSHKAGWIGFRPGEADHLYIATGDGAWRRNVADPYQVSQNLRSNLGKMLRVDISRDDYADDSGRNYAIPRDNPWADGMDANAEIWSYGLRNPFRASFDRLTGDLWLADVGFTQWDEVDFLANGSPGGTNWGWDLREGGSGPEVPGATDPVFVTPVGSGAAIIGGVVYRGPDTSLAGRYVFADYVTGRIRSLRYDGSQVSEVQDLTARWLADVGPAAISSFGEDAAGRLYLTDLAHGRLLALSTPVPEPAPAALMLAGLAGLLARRRRAGPPSQPLRTGFRPAPGR